MHTETVANFSAKREGRAEAEAGAGARARGKGEGEKEQNRQWELLSACIGCMCDMRGR